MRKINFCQNDSLAINKNNTFHEGKFDKLYERMWTRLSSALYYKSFTIVIYDRNDNTIVIYDSNDSGQYYKTINYNPRVIIYNPILSLDHKLRL